jgi:hypothetical protein
MKTDDELYYKNTGFSEEMVKKGIALLYTLDMRRPLPKILPGSNESIDIRWDADTEFGLILNIPVDGDHAQFHGSNKYGEEISGTVNLKGREFDVVNTIINWLKRESE